MRWLVVPLLVLGVALLKLSGPAGSPTVVQTASPSPGPSPAAVSGFFGKMGMDDSGLFAGREHWTRFRDPRSFDDLRVCYSDAGIRGAKLVSAKLAAAKAPPARLKLLVQLARLHLYEGKLDEAGAALAQALAIVDAPGPLAAEKPAVLWLSAITAMRRGETENCVAHGGHARCIVPFAASAVHSKPRGSREAIGFMMQYLKLQPDDMGARWVVNVAHMTLGEYPDGVPRELLLDPTVFHGPADIKRFTDVAGTLGVDRFDQSGGSVMDDFDGDGMLDVVTCSWDQAVAMSFFRNQGDGTFADRTPGSGLEAQYGGFTICQTDYDNDGKLDLFVSRGAIDAMRQSLLRNEGGGKFRDVTFDAKISAPSKALSAAWGDYDNDGWLDLYIPCEQMRSRLYHNNRDGTFTERALEAGVENFGGSTRGAAWGDFDNDRWPDLFVSNVGASSRLYRNNRDGTFTDVAGSLGIGPPNVGFSCWWFDYDNDGWLDIFAASNDQDLGEAVKSLVGQPTRLEPIRLYRNIQGKRFEDVTRAVGLETAPVVMGSNFADFDNDGWIDMYLGTGAPPYSMLLPNRMFRNVEGKKFVDVTAASGTGHLQKGHQISIGDWDRDGDADIYLQVGGATPGDKFSNVLFQNPGHPGGTISMRLEGKQSNRAAIGARIAVTAGGRTMHRQVDRGSTFGGNPFEQMFGVGSAKAIDAVEVFWPTSNTRQRFTGVPVGAVIAIREGDPQWRRIERPSAARR